VVAKVAAPVSMETESRAKPKRAISKAAVQVPMDVKSRTKRSAGAAFDESVVVAETKRRRVEVPTLVDAPTEPTPPAPRRSTRLAAASTITNTRLRLAAPVNETPTAITAAIAPVQRAPAPVPMLAQPNAVVHNVQPAAGPVADPNNTVHQHPQAAAPFPIAPTPQPQNRALDALREIWSQALDALPEIWKAANRQAAFWTTFVFVVCLPAYGIFKLHGFLFEDASTATSFTDLEIPANFTDSVFQANFTDPVFQANFTDSVFQANFTDLVFQANSDMVQGNSYMADVAMAAHVIHWITQTFGRDLLEPIHARPLSCVRSW
jgi:hypothetical protein